MKQLTFHQEYRYKDDEAGIPVEVKLFYAGQGIGVWAKVDPGAAVCLFSNEIGLSLGIPVEAGIPIILSGLSGSLEAFGHEVTLQTGDIAFQSFVYFAKYRGLEGNLLGRQG